jgi:hypothetical protein
MDYLDSYLKNKAIKEIQLYLTKFIIDDVDELKRTWVNRYKNVKQHALTELALSLNIQFDRISFNPGKGWYLSLYSDKVYLGTNHIDAQTKIKYIAKSK